MPLRPAPTFNIVVATIAFALVAESALLWSLSQRPQHVATSPAATFSPTPVPEPLFTAPGVEPPGITTGPVTSGSVPETVPAAPTDPKSAVLTAPASIKPGAGTEKLSPAVRAQAKELFDAGTAALARKDGKTALDKFRAVIAIAPDHLATRLNLALLYLDANQPALAVPHLQKASQLAPDLPAPRFYLARALVALKRPNEAVAPLQEVIHLAPKEREAHELLGQICLAINKPRDAYAQWVAIAQNDPRDVEAHLQAAGLAADALKRPQEAAKWLRLALSGSPGDPRPALLLSRLLMAQNDAKGAAKVLGQAAKARPDVFELYPQLANARLAAKDLSGASDAIKSALLRLPVGKTPPEKAQIAAIEGELRLTLGRTLGQSKKPAEARREFERAATLLPRSAEVRSMLALAAMQSGDRKTATAALQGAIAIDPSRAGDRRFLAQLLADGKDWSAANAQYAAYTKLQPRDGSALIEWAGAAHRAKKSDEELQIWSKLATLDPRNPLPHIQRGVLLRDLKRPAEALQSFQRALAIKSDDPNALFESGRLESQLGQARNAAATWRKLITTRPQYAPAYASLLESSDKSGDAPNARLFLARELSQKSDNPQALSEILNFYAKSKRDAEAKAFLADVLKRNPKSRFAKAALDSFGKPSIKLIPAAAPTPPAAATTPAPAATPQPTP